MGVGGIGAELARRAPQFLGRDRLVLILVGLLQHALHKLGRSVGDFVRRDFAVLVLVQPLEEHSRAATWAGAPRFVRLCLAGQDGNGYRCQEGQKCLSHGQCSLDGGQEGCLNASSILALFLNPQTQNRAAIYKLPGRCVRFERVYVRINRSAAARFRKKSANFWGRWGQVKDGPPFPSPTGSFRREDDWSATAFRVQLPFTHPLPPFAFRRASSRVDPRPACTVRSFWS
jgi:hypothetical protein